MNLASWAVGAYFLFWCFEDVRDFIVGNFDIRNIPELDILGVTNKKRALVKVDVGVGGVVDRIPDTLDEVLVDVHNVKTVRVFISWWRFETYCLSF